MIQLLKKYEYKRPQVVFEWFDEKTGAEGWVVINSLRGGAAGGGTRMRKGLDKHEVESLAKTMEIKFTVAGPPIGGAKSGINFDPSDPRKEEVLQRWFHAVTPLLKNYYGTGGDLNIDELHEVIPITAEYGLLHPQEGIVTGHLHVGKDEKLNRIGQLRYGVSLPLTSTALSPDISRKIAVADMITGYGVSESVLHFYDLFSGSVKDKKIIIQGWGNVAAAAGFYLSQAGGKIVGIIDRSGGLINEDGFSFAEIKELFLNRKGNALNAAGMLSFEEVDRRIWDIPASIFIPAAASRLVSRQQVERMVKGGLEVIACGANVPFADKEIFFGPIAEYADKNLALIPDFISNCGMARVFAYLMTTANAEMKDVNIFKDTSDTIRNAMQKLRDIDGIPRNLTEKAYGIALKDLV